MMKNGAILLMAVLSLTACSEEVLIANQETPGDVDPPEIQEPGDKLCTNGDLRCKGDDLQKCKSREWVLSKSCEHGCDSTTLQCNSDPDGPDDPHHEVPECTSGTALCGGGILKTCIQEHYQQKTCEFGCDESGRTCALPPTCTDGDVVCNDSAIKTCTNNTWETTTPCPYGCNLDEKSCATACEEGSIQCIGSTLKQCQEGEWANTKDCPLGCAQSGTACAECNADKCEGDQKTTCVGGVWASSSDTCPNGCNDTGTDCALGQTCTEGQTVCTENQVKSCSGNTWTKLKDCPDGCDAAKNDCFVKVCEENALQCSGNELQICTSNAWTKSKDCPVGCDAARKDCVAKVCDDNALQCSGNTLQICTGNAWTKKQDCENGCDASAKKCKEINNNQPTRYLMKSSTHNSPITPYVVQQMKNIMAKNGSRNNNVIMKVGDSHYDAAIGGGSLNYGFMRCFSNSTTNLPVNLDGRNELQAAIDEFQKKIDSFIRDSEAAEGGMSTRYCFQNNHLANEINAINPRFAVFGHGSNDIGNGSFTYEQVYGSNSGYAWAMQDYYRQVNKALDQMISGGIIPLIQGIAPNLSTPANINYIGGGPIDKRDYPRYIVPAFDAISRGIAEARQLPWFDTYNAFYKLNNHGVRDDGVHESTNGSPCNFTAEGLKNGANVRNLGLIQALNTSWQTVINGKAAPDAIEEAFKGSGSSSDPFVITSLPYTHSANTSNSANKGITAYAGSCSTTGEAGPEYYYKLELPNKSRLKIFAVSAANVDVDIHVMKGSIAADKCTARADILLMGTLDAGTYYISVDTWSDANGSYSAGQYLMGIVECMSDDQRCNDPIKAY